MYASRGDLSKSERSAEGFEIGFMHIIFTILGVVTHLGDVGKSDVG
jgi:hypothetical protein